MPGYFTPIISGNRVPIVPSSWDEKSKSGRTAVDELEKLGIIKVIIIQKGSRFMAALHITNENFDQEVLQSDKPVLLDFWAGWCGPCMMLAPVVEELADEVAEAKICKVNVDEQPELAMQFHVANIPMLVVMKDGKIVSKDVGVKNKEELLEMLKAE